MRPFIIGLIFAANISASAQEALRPLTKKVIVKTNVLSLLAQKPTISVEKAFGNSFSVEVSFVQGQFNNFLFTDHYDYNGFLIRTKKYLEYLEFGALNPYGALYAGSLQRNIQTKGQTNNNGWLGYPSRNFSANSVRGGISLGLSYFTKSKFIFDGQASLGYGRYLKLDRSDPDTYSRGYVDTQIWLSIGYCF